MMRARSSPPASPRAQYIPLNQHHQSFDSPGLSPSTPTFRRTSAVSAGESDAGSDEGGWAPRPLAFPSFRHETKVIKPAYTGSEPAYRGAVQETLAKVGLNWSKDDPFVAALEKRLLNPPTPPYQFLVGTMEHNEERDILEWLFYHISQGMDHFVVYDHFSTDSTQALLAPLVDLGWVTYVPYTVNDAWAQPRAFEKFIAEWKLRSKWLFFFDIDEFIIRNVTLLAGTGEMNEPFAEWFDQKYGKYGGVAMPRLSFSSNGRYTHPPEGVLAGYTETREIGRDFFAPKVISQARFKKAGGNIHGQEYTPESGLEMVDPLEKSGGKLWEDKSGYPVYLNHYWSKDFEGCVKRIKQQAFPGSWREIMGDKFCKLEMSMTDDHATLARYQESTLAKYGPGVMTVVERYKQRFPILTPNDFTLSTLSSTRYSTKRVPFLPSSGDRVEPGMTLVVDAPSPGPGFIEVVLSTKNSKRALPVTYRSDGGASFVIPSSTSSDSDSGFHELSIIQQHPAAPDATLDPVSPCSVVGHIRNRPEVPQLQQLVKGECKDVDLDSAWQLATMTWPHSHYRGEVLFRRFFKLSPAPVLPSSDSPFTSSSLSLDALGQGRWKRFAMSAFTAKIASTSPSRLYTTERCPRRFDPGYWDPVCGNETTLAQGGGVLRWVPDGATSYTDYVLPPAELKTCLASGSASPKKVLIVGDSVASHTFMAFQCMLDQAGLPEHEHVRFHSLQYEMFDLVGETGPFTREAWERFISWDYDEVAKKPKSVPDVVVINIGLWAVSWGSAAGYKAGLGESLRILKELEKEHGVKIVWRETTAVFPHKKEGDPLNQINPRVELFNRIANEAVDEAGMERVPAYEMTVPRSDAARDNAHMCSYVQGDLAEVLIHGLCRNVLVA
ncbi:hypothetical protein JCM11641_004087 [Rhodosporidiobolus odoratus]